MRKRSITNWVIAGLCLMTAVFKITSSVQAQSLSIQSTKDYLEAERLIEAIADELYKAHQLYPDFKHELVYESNGLITVTVTGIDNHTIANRIANQIIVLEDLATAVANMDMSLLPPLPEMTMADRLNEQQAEAYQPDVEFSKGFSNVLYTW